MLFLVILYCVTSSLAGDHVLHDARIYSAWPGGFQGSFDVTTTGQIHGWKIHILFSKSIDQFEVYSAEVESHTSTEWIVHNMDHNRDLHPGTRLEITFLARAPGNTAGTVQFWFEPLTTSTVAPTTTTTTTTPLPSTTTTVAPPVDTGTANVTDLNMRYDYSYAMSLSVLFYDAQRSGRLPANNPIPWRGDSAVNDGDNGHDLSGGWYDAGDYVKFNLPMAWSTWVLNYGFLKFKDAYIAANQKDKMCDMVKWPLEYFLKCWIPASQTLYVQVGNGHKDHLYWGRAETLNMDRPAYSINPSCPGSDVAGKTVSAMASGYLVFKDICQDLTFANKLLTAAKSLYYFAKANKGKYSDCVLQASDFYGSTGYLDELSTAAVWLYKATNESMYLSDAKSFYPAGTAWGFNWDDDNVGTALLLYEETKDDRYKEDIESFIADYNGGSVPMTPCGLSYRDRSGPNRHAANAAFIATVAAVDGLNPDQYKKYAMSQIDFMLGDNKQNMSFEIGFGDHFPKKPNHRGSSCLITGSKCNPFDPGNNPNQLNGALVSGPDEHGVYIDERSDYIENSVAVDYNAGFQGALAGLYYFANTNTLPDAPPPHC